MIVEDEEDIRLLERVMLAADPGFLIAGEAASAEEAVEVCRKEQPSLIILDHQLAGEMSGLEAAASLKAAAPGSKVLLFTNQDVGREAGENPAIDRYLPKREIGRLVEIVQEMLGSQG